MVQTTSAESGSNSIDDVGKLLLRVTVGGLMLFHGVDKLIHGVGGIESMLTARGLPGAICYGVYIGEVVAPLGMILGVLTRLSAVVFAFNMLVAVLLAHAGEVFALGQHGEWAIELNVLYFMGAICVALLGPGSWAVWQRRGLLA